MKPALCTDPRLVRAQRGDALLEALIGILLMAVIGLGLSYAVARVLNSQRYTTTQNIAIMQMRNLLATNNNIQTFCTSTENVDVTLNPQAVTPTTVTLPATINCSPTSSIAVGVTGNTGFNENVSFLTRLSISTPANNNSAKSLFGGDGVISLSQ